MTKEWIVDVGDEVCPITLKDEKGMVRMTCDPSKGEDFWAFLLESQRLAAQEGGAVRPYSEFKLNYPALYGEWEHIHVKFIGADHDPVMYYVHEADRDRYVSLEWDQDEEWFVLYYDDERQGIFRNEQEAKDGLFSFIDTNRLRFLL